MLDHPEHTDIPEVPDTIPAYLTASQTEAKLEWSMIGTGFAVLMSVVAMIIALVALSSNSATTVTAAASPAAPASSAPAIAPASLTLGVKSDVEHARKGPDGQWHDAFVPAGFAVRAGQKVTVTVYNYDSGPHTFTAPGLGVNVIIPGGGSLSAPKVVTFTFTAPSKPGAYQWWCGLAQCDPWAMAHNGYMRGFVTVKA